MLAIRTGFPLFELDHILDSSVDHIALWREKVALKRFVHSKSARFLSQFFNLRLIAPSGSSEWLNTRTFPSGNSFIETLWLDEV